MPTSHGAANLVGCPAGFETRQNIHRHRNEDIKKPELRHCPRDGREKYPDGRRKKEKRQVPNMSNGTEPLIGTCSSPCTTNSSDNQAATASRGRSPRLFPGDLEAGQRHNEEVIHGAMLPLANHRRASENDGEHRDIIDNAHDACEPARRLIRVDRDANGEIDRRLGDRLRPRDESVGFRADDFPA